MSFFKSIGRVLKKVAAPVIGGLIGGPVGAAIGGISRGAPAVVSAGKAIAKQAPRRGGFTGRGQHQRTIPGAGALVGGGAALGLLGGGGAAVQPAAQPTRRRRRRGITATEIKNHARVEKFLDKNYKCKSGGSRRSYIRKK